MNKGLSALLITIGVIVYLLVLVLQLFSFLSNVGFLLFPLIAILAQIALGVPILCHLSGKCSIPLLDYTKCLTLLVSVLAVSGYLGIPDIAVQIGGNLASASYEDDILDVREDLGEKEKLALAVDLAEAKSDEDKKKVRKQIEEVDKRLSESDRKDYQREQKTYEAEQRLARWGRDVRNRNLALASLDNALLIIAAFVMLAGAFTMPAGGASKEEESSA